jgi:hypothetical protein
MKHEAALVILLEGGMSYELEAETPIATRIMLLKSRKFRFKGPGFLMRANLTGAKNRTLSQVWGPYRGSQKWARAGTSAQAQPTPTSTRASSARGQHQLSLERRELSSGDGNRFWYA